MSVTDYDYKADNGVLSRRSIGDLESMVKILEKTTKEHVKLMQQLQYLTETTENENTEGDSVAGGDTGAKSATTPAKTGKTGAKSGITSG